MRRRARCNCSGQSPQAGFPTRCCATATPWYDVTTRSSSTIHPRRPTKKCIQEITILNKSGASKSYFSCYTDRTRSLRSFSGAVYDEQGKLIRKLKRSDLQYTEYSSSSLAQDGAVYYLQVDVPQSCYTVRFEHEIAHRNGILTFPVFLPQSSTATALLSGSYTITLPRNTPFGWKSLRAGEPEHDSTEETET
ncbi:DUF3857 domain-containing protein [uncultured Alistipes sp.]|uniref:DUF3857 domain-containing protein n=1 Tax=uncultured Alistipes sp. TaxID=538949 RepID=UPI0025E1DDF6|nr:DUF3857 domain-containing protein [uncultured Alistipes sp.]